MKKTEMISNVASEADVTNKIVESVLDAYSKFILGALAENKTESIPLPGIGSFSVKHVSERSGIVRLGKNKGSEWHKDPHDEIQFKITKTVKTL